MNSSWILLTENANIYSIKVDKKKWETHFTKENGKFCLKKKQAEVLENTKHNNKCAYQTIVFSVLFTQSQLYLSRILFALCIGLSSWGHMQVLWKHWKHAQISKFSSFAALVSVVIALFCYFCIKNSHCCFVVSQSKNNNKQSLGKNSNLI